MMAKAVLLGILAAPILSVPAYGQQEVNPTWYDPWASVSNPAPHRPQDKAAERKGTKGANVSSHVRQKTRTDARKRDIFDANRTQEIAKK